MTGGDTDEENHEGRLRAAAGWYAALQAPDAGAAAWDAFRNWERDPRNAAAFRDIEAALSVVDRTSLGVPETASSRARRPAGGWIAAAVAASVLVAAGVSILVTAGEPEPLAYATTAGERRDVGLTDGSTVTLNTATRIEVALSGKARRVKLMKGQALFEVETGPVPFIVEAAGTSTIALGTAFEVYLTPTGTQVTLLDGSVSVASAGDDIKLRPGERLVVAGGVARPIELVDLDAALSWRTGILQFTGVRLADAIEELNRYSDTRILIDDPVLADERLSGSFKAGDQDQFVSALGLFLPVEARRSDDCILIVRSNAENL